MIITESIIEIKRERTAQGVQYTVDNSVLHGDQAIAIVECLIDVVCVHDPNRETTSFKLTIETVDSVSFVSLNPLSRGITRGIGAVQKMAILALVKRFRPDIKVSSWFPCDDTSNGDYGIYINHEPLEVG